MNLFSAILTVPPQVINTIFGTNLLNHNSDGVGEANGVMWCVWRKQIHVTFVNGDINEFVRRWINGLEKHVAAILVEVFWGRIDVIVGAGIRTSNDHDSHVFVGY